MCVVLDSMPKHLPVFLGVIINKLLMWNDHIFVFEQKVLKALVLSNLLEKIYPRVSS